MSSMYSLHVHSANGITWNVCPLRRKTPNLYVVIRQEGTGVQRTRTVPRSLTPTWEHVSKLFSESAISLSLFHRSSFLGRKICLGVADTTVTALLELCSAEECATSVKLELAGVRGMLKGKPAGTLSVYLEKDVDANATAITAIAQVQKDVSKLDPTKAFAVTTSAAGVAVEYASTAQEFESALGTLTDKLGLIVTIGDKIATIHPYASIAWKVFTSVYQLVKKQQETDDKVRKLVQKMVDVYSFVDDINSLAEKIQSLEDNVLAIVKQTVECALFIQEYTENGFCSRAVRSTLGNADNAIDDLYNALVKLKESFDGRLTIQGLFLSTKVLQKLDALGQSDALKKLNPVDMNASSRPTCLLGTRRQILDEITEWITVPHPDAVIRTLAYSLALSNPQHIGKAISDAILRDQGVVNAPIGTQFKKLLLEPLSSVKDSMHGPILIILDALDECGDHHSRAALLSILSREFPNLPSLFRILITSRAEQDIDIHFGSRFRKRDLDPAASPSNEDVRLFIVHEMNRIRDENNVEAPWPEEQHIQDLAKISGGLFILASTATKFIDDYPPNQRLETLVTQNSAQPFKLSAVDALFGGALRCAGNWDTNEIFAQHAHAVLACVVLGRVPMTETTMDGLLGLSNGSAAGVLKFLGCVVQWSPGAHARMHASILDYLTDPKRSGRERWAINTRTDHRSLLLGCLRILDAQLRFNICCLKDSHTLNDGVHDLGKLVDAHISPELSYASCFWFNHIQETQFDNDILAAFEKLFYGKFLHWLEVLSVSRKMHIASPALEIALRYIKGYSSAARELEDFIRDTTKFVSAFAPLMAQSAIHIYLSALPFAPQRSMVAQGFMRGFPNTLTFASVLGANWPSIRMILRGHSGPVTSVSFSSDGTRIASGSEDNTVRIWNAETCALVAGPCEHPASVTAVHVSPNASGSIDTTDVTDPCRGHVTSVHFSPDRTRVVSGSTDHTLCIWNAQTGALIVGPFGRCTEKGPDGHAGGVTSVHFSPDGSRVAFGSWDKTIRIWNVQTGTLVAGPFTGHTDVVCSVNFSPNGKQVASGSADNTVRIWNAETCELVAGPCEEHTNLVTSVHFSPDGTRVASGSADHTVRIWNPQTGALVAGPFNGHTEAVTSVHFSPDGSQVASGSWDKTIRIWDARSGALVVGPLTGHTNTIFSVNFSPNGTRIASGSAANTVRIWDTQPDTPVAGPVDERQANLTGAVAGPVEGHTDAILSVNFSPNGSRVVTGSMDKTVRIWDAQTGRPVARAFQGHDDKVTSVIFSPDGLRVASGSWDMTINISDAQSGILIVGPMKGHTSLVTSVDFSPHGTLVGSGSADKTVRIWDAQSGAPIGEPFQHTQRITCVKFSPDGTRIASGSRDNTVRVWDTQTGVPVGISFEGHTGAVTSVHFSADGSRIASGSEDETVRVWDARTGALVAGPFHGHTDGVTSVNFSPDGTRIVSGSSDRAVCIWDARTGAIVAGPLKGHSDLVTCVNFASDGERIASASKDCTVRINDVTVSRMSIMSPEPYLSLQVNATNSPLGNFPKFDSFTGWVLNAAEEHMFWVPPWLRDGLYLPHNRLVIRAKGTTTLDLSRFVHGTEWEKCRGDQ
ncbi:WD40 repeat-like protein [Mycena venus]|uniref:WD40 repeat-like protein n=1 Tax=Mycena venus TaxID=2733690 RepID=A0A8H6X3H2_9AGAR|nr:WD40 repeat-like protein [Mycena venus]